MWGSELSKTLVIQGHSGLLVPEYPNVLDSTQKRPVYDTRKWIDLIFKANVHLTGPFTQYDRKVSIFMWLTNQLHISEITRDLPADGHIRHDSRLFIGPPAINEVRTTPHVIFGITNLQTHESPSPTTYPNGTYTVEFEDRREEREWPHEAQDRDLIQTAVHMVMEDLGAPPAAFTAQAVNLATIRQRLQEQQSNHAA